MVGSLVGVGLCLDGWGEWLGFGWIQNVGLGEKRERIEIIEEKGKRREEREREQSKQCLPHRPNQQKQVS